MAVPHGTRFPIAFDDLFPHGAYLMGDIQPLPEFQSQEDKARNRPVRPRIDDDLMRWSRSRACGRSAHGTKSASEGRSAA